MSNRVTFIKHLYDLNQHSGIADNYARYLEMGRQCALTEYLDGHTSNYLFGEQQTRPFATGNGFIALNVEAAAGATEPGAYVPFFSIARDGRIDTPELRDACWAHTRREDDPGYLTCPVFMNELGLDKILIRVSIRGGAVEGAEVRYLSAFDEEETDMIRTHSPYIIDYLRQFRRRNFLDAWCEPFLDRDQDLFCDIRAVDRDEQYTAHSFYAVIFNSEQECKDWVSAYGEDIMNIIVLVKSVFIGNLHRKQQSEAVKSAISAIMSRNMSHNLGSHYLYYTKTYLEELAASCGEKGPDIRGAARVLGYMQARMDYLATIVTNDRFPDGAVNFKSQIFDELTVDSFTRRHFRARNDRCKRTSNFLLANLILSENFTRPGILAPEDRLAGGGKFKPLRLQVKLWLDGRYETFTGTAVRPDVLREERVRNELSKLNIALPGGTMSCHAFFNVVENFIRNSAKYLQQDFSPEGLVFTIAVRRSADRPDSFDFVLSDNKHNAARVIPILVRQLENLRILDGRGRIEKSSKGLKEMLFSSVWMRAGAYPDDTFADVINRIQSEIDHRAKLALISRYGFSVVAVGDDGTVRDGAPQAGDNLGIRLTLPEYSFLSSPLFDRIEVDPAALDDFVRQAGVLADDPDSARRVFQYKSLLDKRFAQETGGDIDQVCLWLGDRKDMKRLPREHSRIIYFERHLSTKLEGFAPYADYAYVDSISGGNFTVTLKALIENGLTERGRYKTWQDKLFGLKIKESALTRITIIDERLYNNMCEAGPAKAEEYAFRNIRVLNANFHRVAGPDFRVADLFEGSAFRDGADRTHFLSIHLGLIEKVINTGWDGGAGPGATLSARVARFMDALTARFAGPGGLHITVHSGRGNFSKEMEGPLSAYPFISLSAIENAFSNSKYLLSQLFYNTLYNPQKK